MTDQTSTLRIQADASGVEAGVATAKRSLASLGGAAAQAGKQGADGLAALGNGGDVAARKVDSATKSMVGSIQRQIAAMEAGGTSSRQYQESLAKLRGIDVSALKPYLDQLDAAKVKATAAAKATDGLKSAASGISGTLAALGVSLSAGAFLAFVSNINNGVDALNDLKDATGASIENISALEDVAKRTGTSFDTVGTALIKLNQGLSAAKPGSDTERAIKAIGLSVVELKTLDPAEAFRRIAVSLSGFEDDANKARLTQELFGKSLKEVAPLLKDLADQGQLNATVTTAQAEAAEKLNKQIFNLQKNALDAGRAITGALVPALDGYLTRFTLAYKQTGSLVDTLALGARMNPFKDLQGNLAAVEQQIGALEQRAGRITSDSARKGNDQMIADLRTQAEYIKSLQLAAGGAGGGRGSINPEFAGGGRQSVGDVLAGDGGKAAASAAAKALADQNRELADQAKLLATLSGVNGDYQEQLTRLQVVRKSQNLSDARYSELVTELIDKQPMVKALYAEQEKSAKAWEDQAKASARAVAELSKDYDAYVKTLDASAAAVDAQVQKLQDEEAATVIAAAQNISLAQAIEQVTIARLGEAQTKAYKNGDQEAGDAIKREIEARKKLATAIGGKEVREANKKAADDAAKEWQKTADKINDSITDALMRGFEDGKGFAQNMRDTIENIFKTMVLRPVVQATVNTGLQAIGLPGIGGSGGGVGGLFKNASDAYGLYDKASSLFGGSANSAFGFAGLAGAGTAAGASAVLPALTTAAIEAGITAGGASIYSIGAAAGAAGVTTAAAGGGTLAASGVLASGAATTAAAGTGATAGAAAAIPGIGWAIGGALLLAGLIGGSSGTKLQSTGDAIRRYDKDGALTENATNGAWFFTNTEAANKMLDMLESRYQQSAKALGIGTVATQFDYGSNNRGNFALAGAAGGRSANTGEIAYSEEALKVAYSRAVFAALQGSEVPKYLAGLFDSVGDVNALSQQQIDTTLAAAQAFKNLHDNMLLLPFDELKDLSFSAANGLLEFSGGLEKFQANIGAYYDNFYSAEEKKAQTLKNITATLNAAGAGVSADQVGAASRDQFRAIAEGLDVSTEAGQKLYAAMLSVSSAFASVTPAATDAAAALKQQAEATKAAIEAAASARSALLDNATTGAQSAFDALSRSVAAQQAKDVAANEAQRAIATAAFTSQNELYQQQIDSTRKSLDAVGQSVGKLQSFSGSLKSTLDGLRIAGSDGDYRTRAQAQISATLSTARAGGGLPLDGQLASALSTVSKPSEQLFGTFQDYARDFYKTANDIAALGDLTDAQLSADQITQGILTKQVNALSDQKQALKEGFADQLSSLDAILSNAQLQLDAANGINTSVLSVADALTAFASAIAGLESTRAGQGLATSTSTAATTAATARKDAIQQYMQGLADNTNLSDYDKAQTLYAQARLVGVSEAEIAKTVGVSAADARRWFSNFGVPQFAVGTNYVPHDMLAKIHEGEAIIPKAYNPAANGQGGNARLEALVEKLTAEVAELRAAQERGNAHTDRTARILDGQQGVPLLVEIAA